MNIRWKEDLKKLEHDKQWDKAINLLQKTIKENPSNMDAYIFMNFLLMNILVEEEYDLQKEEEYITYAKWYFDESFAKFSNNAEYLYLTAKTAVMSEWFFGISQADYEQMFKTAKYLDPLNLLYKEDYYWELREKDPKNPELIEYAKLILSKNSPIKEQLKTKGMLGEYILGMKENWAKDVLANAEK